MKKKRGVGWTMFLAVAVFAGAFSISGKAHAVQLTFDPVARGSIRDLGPKDGVFDEVHPHGTPNGISFLDNGFQEWRYAFEFDLNSIPANASLTSALLMLTLAGDDQDVELHIYEADGLLSTDDAVQSSSLLATFDMDPTQEDPREIDFDPNDFQKFLRIPVPIASIDSLPPADAYLGFNVREIFSGQNLLLGSAFQRLVVDYLPDSTPVPEPSTLFLLGTGLVGLVGRKNSKHSQSLSRKLSHSGPGVR